MGGAFFIVALMLSTTACSAIITISEDEIRCAREGPVDPCPGGRVCSGGYCQLIGIDSGQPDVPDGGCVPDERGEICNGEDDDCDGMVDEGHDLDMDGFTWCGGGVANQADCDDNDAFSYPGNGVILAAIERCDGADNDCDGMIDEDDGSGTLCAGDLECIDRTCADATDCSLPSVSCSGGEICNFGMNPPQCEIVADSCTPTSCTSPEICNMETGDCVTPARIGDACDTDADCDEAICVRRRALGLSGNSRVCTKTCCVDGECPSGSICWASGTGAKLCADPVMVGTGSGGGAGGSSCSSGTSCASGVCLDEGSCLENCGSDDDCPGPNACTTTVITSRDHLQFSCGAPKGPTPQGEGAFSGACSSGLVLPGFEVCDLFSCVDICLGPCRTTDDCGTTLLGIEFYCGFGSLPAYDSTIAVCGRKGHAGAGAGPGASCASNGGCRDLTCVSGECADTCCSDEDCGDGGGECRPIEIRGHWETHCI